MEAGSQQGTDQTRSSNPHKVAVYLPGADALFVVVDLFGKHVKQIRTGVDVCSTWLVGWRAGGRAGGQVAGPRDRMDIFCLGGTVKPSKYQPDGSGSTFLHQDYWINKHWRHAEIFICFRERNSSFYKDQDSLTSDYYKCIPPLAREGFEHTTHSVNISVWKLSHATSQQTPRVDPMMF